MAAARPRAERAKNSGRTVGAKRSRGPDWNELVRAAESMRSRAYAPYSGYTVGAALLAADPSGAPQVFTGANMENASYGLCVCAERNAVAAAVLAGARDFRALAVATPGPEAGSCCGMCRQVLAEFAVDVPVVFVVGGKIVGRTSSAKMLPGAFTPARLAASKRNPTLKSR